MKSVTVFADESANWKVAGLRQIERLVFALEELALERKSADRLPVHVVWDEAVEQSARRLPQRSYAPQLDLRANGTNGDAPTFSLTTRLLVARGGLSEVLARENNGRSKMIGTRNELPAAERWFMKSLGKSQDGWVARNIDRRISTRISRWLIRANARPLHATFAAFLFGLAGCVMLLRGDYASVLLGTILLYGFSILDGCDGEIARACYRDSAAGRRVDLIVDTLINLLFIICLGVGLGRMREGAITAALIIATEAMLFIMPRSVGAEQPIPSSRYYDRHERMLGRSGALKVSRRVVHVIAQLTKRDVAWVFFLLLAAIGAPAWILHSSLATALLAGTVSAVALIRGPATAPS